MFLVIYVQCVFALSWRETVYCSVFSVMMHSVIKASQLRLLSSQ